MVVLVFLFKSTQDGDGLRRAGLVHHHLLETALQGFVLLEIFLVLVEGSGADGAQFASRQRRLQDVGRVHSAATPARTDQGVYLIYEEDDLSVAVHDILDHSLEPLLELALILRARDERTHIEGEDLAVLKVLGDLPVDYLGGDAFGDGGLADTRLAHEDRVVLRAPAKDLKHTPDLLVPPDHRVELSLRRGLVEVYGIFA